MRFVLYQSQINVEQNYTSSFLSFFFNLGLILIRKKCLVIFRFFANDNENKKSGRIVLLGMIQTIFDQNLSPIDK